jgi:hypothetical protein
MTHVFTVELDQTKIDAFLMRFDYQELVLNRAPDALERKRHPQIPNPTPPEMFVQGIIEDFIDRIVDEHIGAQAARTAHQDAVQAYRAQAPRRRDQR